jgi:hypothetical protein
MSEAVGKIKNGLGLLSEFIFLKFIIDITKVEKNLKLLWPKF